MNSLKQKKFKKSIYLVIDGMRFDTIKDDLKSQKIYPTLTKLAEKGIFKKVVANAQSTQFVLPSIFSLTYPLDNGGYNYGIRNREESYVETIKKHYNKKTIMFSTCNAMGIGTSFDRGFDEIYTTFDFRILIEQKINRTLLYEINLYKKNQITKKKLISIIQKEFGITLDLLKEYYDNYKKDYWPKKLQKINKFVAHQSIAEKKILKENPEAIIKKMQELSGGVYWAALGKINYNSLGFFIEKIKIAVAWRTMRLIGKQSIWPFFFLSHYQVLFSELIQGLCKKLSKIKNEDWHIHMHIMDLHDCRSINRLFHIIGRYKYFIKWLIARLKGNTKHRFIYASSLMYIDACIKELINHMKKENILNETLIVITADHGSAYAESPRKKKPYQGERTYYEYLDIPLIISHKFNKKIKNELCDSMGMTATFLDLLKVPLHSSFKGTSLYGEKKKYVISENAGGGNADIVRRDLYFTITNKKFKMITVLLENKIKIIKLFDIKKDPKELINLYKDETKDQYKTIVKRLLQYVYEERIILFKQRGINKLMLHKN